MGKDISHCHLFSRRGSILVGIGKDRLFYLKSHRTAGMVLEKTPRSSPGHRKTTGLSWSWSRSTTTMNWEADGRTIESCMCVIWLAFDLSLEDEGLALTISITGTHSDLFKKWSFPLQGYSMLWCTINQQFAYISNRINRNTAVPTSPGSCGIFFLYLLKRSFSVPIIVMRRDDCWRYLSITRSWLWRPRK